MKRPARFAATAAAGASDEPFGAGGLIRAVRLKRSSVPDARSFPFCLPALRELDELPLHPHVTFFVGDNGTGKSTLLEAIAVAARFNPEGGTVNNNFATRASHSNLHEFITLIRGHKRPKGGFFLRAESFYNVATENERLGLPSSSGFHAMSHGEAFLAALEGRRPEDALFILDEPEAALSPARLLRLLALMHQFGKFGAQFIVATHSPILMAFPQSRLYELSDAGIRRTTLSETDHYKITRDVLNNPDGAMARLLRDDDLFEDDED